MVSVIIISAAIALILFRFKLEVKKFTYAGCAVAPVKTKLLPVQEQYKDILQRYFPYCQQFKIEIPELYSILTKLLNQKAIVMKSN